MIIVKYNTTLPGKVKFISNSKDLELGAQGNGNQSFQFQVETKWHS